MRRLNGMTENTKHHKVAVPNEPLTLDFTGEEIINAKISTKQIPPPCILYIQYQMKEGSLNVFKSSTNTQPSYNEVS